MRFMLLFLLISARFDNINPPSPSLFYRGFSPFRHFLSQTVILPVSHLSDTFSENQGALFASLWPIFPKKQERKGALCAEFSPLPMVLRGVCAEFSPFSQGPERCLRRVYYSLPMVLRGVCAECTTPMVLRGVCAEGCTPRVYQEGCIQWCTPRVYQEVYIQWCTPRVYQVVYIQGGMPPYYSWWSMPPYVHTTLYTPGYTTMYTPSPCTPGYTVTYSSVAGRWSPGL